MDERAEFQELSLTHLDPLYNYALILTKSATEAEDLLQEALLRAFRGFRTFKRELSFRVWMFSVDADDLDRLTPFERLHLPMLKLPLVAGNGAKVPAVLERRRSRSSTARSG
jgi:hypothetical protein